MTRFSLLGVTLHWCHVQRRFLPDSCQSVYLYQKPKAVVPFAQWATTETCEFSMITSVRVRWTPLPDIPYYGMFLSRLSLLNLGLQARPLKGLWDQKKLRNNDCHSGKRPDANSPNATVQVNLRQFFKLFSPKMHLRRKAVRRIA